MIWPFLSQKKQSSPCEHSAPRCECPNPFAAGYEDRIMFRSMSIHRTGHYLLECRCPRCSEYRAGWECADKDRIKSQKSSVKRNLVKRLQEERDEARRELCLNLMGPFGDERKYAARRGWDCFSAYPDRP